MYGRDEAPGGKTLNKKVPFCKRSVTEAGQVPNQLTINNKTKKTKNDNEDETKMNKNIITCEKSPFAKLKQNS